MLRAIELFPNSAEEYMRIFVPWEPTPNETLILRKIHGYKDEIVSYDCQEIDPDDPTTMIHFLLEHRDDFVYVSSMTHVAAAMLEHEKCGWMEFRGEQVIAVFHYVNEKFRGHSERFRRVWWAEFDSRKISSSEASLYLVH